MPLPGGVLCADSTVDRSCILRGVDGRLELQLHQDVSASRSVEEAIDAVIDHRFTLPPGKTAQSLCQADRLYILAQIAMADGLHTKWISGACPSCGENIDICIELNQLPCKLAGPSYPVALVESGSTTRCFRVPVSADFVALPQENAVAALTQRCAMEPVSTTFSNEELAKIDLALQEASPEIAESAQTTCPQCTTTFDISIDLAAIVLTSLPDPIPDVHRVALAYHWSEDDILDLPRDRRKLYLALIERDSGYVQ